MIFIPFAQSFSPKTLENQKKVVSLHQNYLSSAILS